MIFIYDDIKKLREIKKGIYYEHLSILRCK